MYLPLFELAMGMCAEPEEHAADGGLNHSRGKSTYVFVPWDQVTVSQLNLPVSAMDFYVPG